MEAVEKVQRLSESLQAEMRKIIVGQEQVIEQLLVALLADGHVLLEGVPGIAKTLMVKALALTLGLEFTRIQFTPDLMPSDVIGTNIYDLQKGEFRLKRGPIFTNLLLADEVNRTPPKTQAALLEAMEERQATIDGVRYPLPEPFLVFATQNPIEYEGTYPLPEAQLDRFLLKLELTYPSAEEEQEILLRYHQGFHPRRLEEAGLQQCADARELMACRAVVQRVQVEPSLFRYITAIVGATRQSADLSLGASPRASIALLLASKALAAMRGRDFVIPDDIKALAPPVLRHRILLRPEVEIEGRRPDDIIRGILGYIQVPR